MSHLLFVNGISSKSFFRVFKLQWHGVILILNTETYRQTGENLKAENLHPPSGHLVTAVFSKEAALRHCTLTIWLHTKQGSYSYMLTFELRAANLSPLRVFGEQAKYAFALSSICLPQSKSYCRLAGQWWAMLSHWKEPSDSDFTILCICMHLPLSMPKEQSWWQSNCMYVLAPHGILPCGPLLQW